MSAKSLCLSVVAAWLAASASAPLRAEPSMAPGASLPPRAERAALWQRTTVLAQLHQSPGQSDQDFLVAVSASIDAWTHAVVAEVCGVFERDDVTTRLFITLVTQGSPAFCLNRKPGTARAEGSLEGASIHSHVDARRYRGVSDCGLRLMGERFSPIDYAAGPGYLVHRGRLWHQRGPGSQRLIARIEGADTEDATPFAFRPVVERVRACA